MYLRSQGTAVIPTGVLWGLGGLGRETRNDFKVEHHFDAISLTDYEALFLTQFNREMCVTLDLLEHYQKKWSTQR